MTATWLHQTEMWREYYLLVGTAAATLLALMFVVVSLGPHVVAAQAMTGVRAFFTPIIIYFTTSVVASAVMMAPAVRPWVLAAVLMLVGVGGLAYMVATGAHDQWRLNKLPTVDWYWFVGLPTLGYVIFLPAAVGVGMQASFGLYCVAAAALLLLVIGIRNAWDVVLWIAEQPRS
jgi:hypothetical protein